MKKFVKWHKLKIRWWQEQYDLSAYQLLWISFFKGIILTVLIYTIFL